jgi:hypothetical protein
MKILLVVLSMVIGFAAPSIAAGLFPRYAETVWLNADGSTRLDVEVDCPAGTPAPLRLPWSGGALTGVTVSGIDGATAAITVDGERHYMVITFSGSLAAPATVRVSGAVGPSFAAMQSPPKAFGNRTITYRFLNTTPSDFAAISSQIVLPDGFVVTAIADSDPPATESSAAPPFAVTSRDGRHAVSLAASHVGFGGAISVTFRFKERNVSPGLRIALVLLGAAYLAGFRSLISSPDTVR